MRRASQLATFSLIAASLAWAAPSDETVVPGAPAAVTSGCTEWGDWGSACLKPACQQSRQRVCLVLGSDDDNDEEAKVIDEDSNSTVVTENRPCDCVEDPSPPAGNLTNITEACTWGPWSKCDCSDHLQQRRRTCDDDDTDEDEASIEKQECACDAITVEGEAMLGGPFRVAVDVTQAPKEHPGKWKHHKEIQMALQDITSQQNGGTTQQRRLLEAVGPCSAAFNPANPVFPAIKNPRGQWVSDMLSEKAGIFRLCLRSPDGDYGEAHGTIVVQGPVGINLAGGSCLSSDSIMEVPSNNLVEVQVKGISLEKLTKWGLALEGETCPPKVVRNVEGIIPGSGSRSVTASRSTDQVSVGGVGQLKVCYYYNGQWLSIPTCARSVLVDSAVVPETANSSQWVIIGVVLGVLGAASIGAVWGFTAYRKQKRSKMETMFDIPANPNNQDSEAVEATPAAKSLAQSQGASRTSTPGQQRGGSVAASGTATPGTMGTPNPLRPLSSSRAPTVSPARQPETSRPASAVAENIRSSPKNLDYFPVSPSRNPLAGGTEIKDEVILSPVNGVPFTPSGGARRRLHPTAGGADVALTTRET